MAPKRAIKAAKTTRRSAGRRRARAASRPGVVPARKKREPQDPRLRQMLKIYEEATRQFNRQNFRRAKELLEKVLQGPSRQLADRAQVHLAICEQRLGRSEPVKLRSADDHYYYAVSQINLGRYEEGRAHLEKAVKMAPRADYVHYALATLAALTQEADRALEHLERAITLRPENRFQARNDSDFRLLADTHRFRELVGNGASPTPA